MAWITSNLPIILGVMLAISEGLSQIPGWESNGIIDMIKNIAKGGMKLIGGK